MLPLRPNLSHNLAPQPRRFTGTKAAGATEAPLYTCVKQYITTAQPLARLRRVHPRPQYQYRTALILRFLCLFSQRQRFCSSLRPSVCPILTPTAFVLSSANVYPSQQAASANCHPYATCAAGNWPPLRAPAAGPRPSFLRVPHPHTHASPPPSHPTPPRQMHGPAASVQPQARDCLRYKL